ncbi:transposase family protein [Streptomyces sp. NPDC002205]|uniref:transposase family protein n=1 Tax=Streptomyces sp. NPDC002205 TaxID=3154411 RepID=UPI0033335E07
MYDGKRLWQDFRSRRSSWSGGRPIRVVGSLWLCSVELHCLLPHLTDVLVGSVDASAAVVVVQARTRSGAPAACTGCGTLSQWIHSRYVRRVFDVVIGSRPVQIELSVRRLYCENSACPKVTFAEQVPGLTVRYQRRTPLLQHVVEAARVVLAGRGGGAAHYTSAIEVLRRPVESAQYTSIKLTTRWSEQESKHP